MLTDVPTGALFTDTTYTKPSSAPITYVAGLQAPPDSTMSPVGTDDVPVGPPTQPPARRAQHRPHLPIRTLPRPPTLGQSLPLLPPLAPLESVPAAHRCCSCSLFTPHQSRVNASSPTMLHIAGKRAADNVLQIAPATSLLTHC